MHKIITDCETSPLLDDDFKELQKTSKKKRPQATAAAPNSSLIPCIFTISHRLLLELQSNNMAFSNSLVGFRLRHLNSFLLLSHMCRQTLLSISKTPQQLYAAFCVSWHVTNTCYYTTVCMFMCEHVYVMLMFQINQAACQPYINTSGFYLHWWLLRAKALIYTL